MEWVDLGFWGLFLATFLAATVVPFSSEFVLVALIAAGFEPLGCLIVATAGNSLGGLSSYAIGRLGDYQRISKWLNIKADKIDRWKPRIDQYGHWMALLCWTPIIGDPIAVALGVFKVRWVPVAILMAVGKGLRYAGLIYAQTSLIG